MIKEIIKRRTKRYSKFGSKKIHDPLLGVFDSQLEYKVYKFLLELQKQGEIHDLERQVTYTLLPTSQYLKFKKLKTKNKYQQHTLMPVKYIADFVYVDKKGYTHVADAKGKKTDVYQIKKKMMLQLHNIWVEEWKTTKLRTGASVFDVSMGYVSSTDQSIIPWDMSLIRGIHVV